jgi:hypothetical protein
MRAFLYGCRRAAAGRLTCVSLAVLLTAASAHAQTFETVGTRALGMGGAFVAVADDATAVYWNPAGLANSAIFDLPLQRASTNTPFPQQQPTAQGAGWRATTTFFGFALPSFGVSYLRTRVQQAAAPIAGLSDGRKTDRPGMAALSSLATDQVGVTLLQTLFANLVAGTTLKLARGSFATALVPAASLSASLDQAAELPASAATRFDLDVGVLAFGGPFRVGVTGRNLLEPDFGPDAGTVAGRMPRQVRLGIAVTPGFVVNRTAASQPSLTIAVDADLTRTTLVTGEERHVAAGVERWVKGRRLGLRGGVRVNTVGGQRRPLGTAGASVAVRPGVLLEGHFARGGNAAGQQWSVGGRVTF